MHFDIEIVDDQFLPNKEINQPTNTIKKWSDYIVNRNKQDMYTHFEEINVRK
jgi:hypothetical protein